MGRQPSIIRCGAGPDSSARTHSIARRRPYDSLRDHNYSFYASCTDFSLPDNCALEFNDKPLWLPQYAVTFNPVENLTLYGNYGVMLSLGPQGAVVGG